MDPKTRPLTALIWALACTSDGLGPDGHPDFGVPYDIEVTATLPALIGNQVAVHVGYAECRERPHEFTIHHRLRGNDADIWLRKTTPEPGCDMHVEQTVELTVPSAVAAAASVTILGPRDRQSLLRPR